MAHRVDAHRDGEHQRLVLAVGDLHSVRVPNAEPALRNAGDGLAVTRDLVLVVDEVALGVEIGPPFDLDREPIADADERFLDGGDRVAVTLDLHLVAHAQLALLKPGDLVAARVLEHERLANAKRLAIDVKGAPAILGLDPVVVADRKQILPHLVAGPDGPVSVSVPEESHVRPLLG